jgi:hypothetical protein
MTLRTIDCNGELAEGLTGDTTSRRLMDCGGETDGRPFKRTGSQCPVLEAKVTGMLARTPVARVFTSRGLYPRRGERPFL